MNRNDVYSGPQWFGIGVERPKFEVNFGTLWRSAVCLGADFLVVIGGRFRKQPGDTTKAWRHIPIWHFPTVDDFQTHRPFDCQLVGVELTDDAKPLESFVHPYRALYLLGPEDGSLSQPAQSVCQSIVSIRSQYCLNVATAGSIVMYDRQTKG